MRVGQRSPGLSPRRPPRSTSGSPVARRTTSSSVRWSNPLGGSCSWMAWGRSFARAVVVALPHRLTLRERRGRDRATNLYVNADEGHVRAGALLRLGPRAPRWGVTCATFVVDTSTSMARRSHSATNVATLPTARWPYLTGHETKFGGGDRRGRKDFSCVGRRNWSPRCSTPVTSRGDGRSRSDGDGDLY